MLGLVRFGIAVMLFSGVGIEATAQQHAPMGLNGTSTIRGVRSNSFVRRRINTERNTHVPPKWDEYPVAEWSGKQLYKQIMEEAGPVKTFDWSLSRYDRAGVGETGTGSRSVEVIKVADAKTIIVRDYGAYRFDEVAISGVNTAELTTGSVYAVKGKFERMAPYSWIGQSLPYYKMLTEDTPVVDTRPKVPFLREWKKADGDTFEAWIIDYDSGNVGFVDSDHNVFAVEKADLAKEHQALVAKFVRARYLFDSGKSVKLDYMGHTRD